MSESVHTARWIRQLSGQGWDIHLFPSTDYPPHDSLTEVTLHRFSSVRPHGTDPGLRVRGPFPFRTGSYILHLVARRTFPRFMSDPARLASVIRRIKPDIVHSLEIQHAASLTLAAKRLFGEGFPRWFVSAWGNDLYLFGRLKSHSGEVRDVLADCDCFTSDCERDLPLARQYGFVGETFPALPGAGGFDIELAKKLRPPGLTSERRVIALKGYQSWYGRALDGLRAIEMCADVLRDYTIVVYFANFDVSVAAELMSQRTGLRIEIFPQGSFEDSLRLHGRARVSVGVNISDGLPLSSMEAALMGSFPVQTDTSCVGERLSNGVGTLLVPPDDIEGIAAAIRRAVTDDELVNHAAQVNISYISENLSVETVRQQVIAMYEQIYSQRRIRR
jgi:glycosyltransferase involved in cell wall biosynthesis